MKHALLPRVAIVSLCALAACTQGEWAGNPAGVEPGARASGRDRLVWFHPSYHSDDYFALYYHPDSTSRWASVRAQIDAVSLHWDRLDNATQAQVETVAYFFEHVDSLTKMAVLGPVINAQHPFAGPDALDKNQRVVQKMEDAGKTVDYWYSMPSFYRAIADSACSTAYAETYGVSRWDSVMDYAAIHFENLCADMLLIFPDLTLGSHEPYPGSEGLPEMRKRQHEAWIDKLVSMEIITFYITGVNENALRNFGSLAELAEIGEYARSQGLQWGYMLKGDTTAESDQEYYSSVMSWCPVVEDSLGVPDISSFHHWGQWSPQRNLPECFGRTYTQLVRDYINRYWGERLPADAYRERTGSTDLPISDARSLDALRPVRQ
jgi:hypothetical protein